MTKPISNEEREKIVKLKENGKSNVEIARWFFITPDSVGKVIKRFNETGKSDLRYENCGRKSVIIEKEEKEIKEEYLKKPDMAYSEIINKLKLRISESGLSKWMKKHVFAEYLKTQLKPVWRDSDTLLMDNSFVHESKLVLRTSEELKIKYKFIPRYSPDYNPIELLWSYTKKLLRKAEARTHEALDEAIASILDSLPARFALNWYKHCGFTC